MNFDPNGATAVDLVSTNARTQGFVAKYDQSGNLVWANETNWRNDLYMDSYSFKLSINPAGNKLVISHTGASGSNEYNSGVIYDATGVFVKELSVLTSGNDPWDFNGACIDDQDAIYFYGSIPTGITYALTYEYDANGDYVVGSPQNSISGSTNNLFIQKMDASSNQVYFKKCNNTNTPTIEDLVFYGGSLYMVGRHGSFIESNFFGIEIRNPDNTPAAYTSYGYVMKLNTSATPTWVKTVGSNQMNETIRALYVDGSSIYTVGRSEDHFSPTSSGGEFFISVRAQNGPGSYLGAYWRGNKTFAQRWDMNGIVNWGTVMHGDDPSHSVHALSIQGNATNIAIGGIFSNTITFNGSDSRTAVGSYDGFMALYDATDGSYMNTFTYGTTSDDRVNTVALIGEDVYTGGQFYGTIDQDFSSTSSNLTTLGSRDGLLSKHSINNPVPCIQTAPVISGFSNLSHHGTTVSWNPTDVPTGGDFMVRYHKFGDSPNFSWKTVSATQTSAYVNGLDASQKYVFRVGARCDGQGSASYSDTMSVVIKKYCPKPTNLITTPSVSSATVSWDDMGADSYKVRFREVGAPSWRHRNTTLLTAELGVLTPSTQYEWQIRAVCNIGGSKAYGATENFSTPSVRLATSESISSFNLYPNPTTGSIKVQFELNAEASISAQVKDMTGRVVEQQSASGSQGFNQLDMELSDLPMGVYVIQLFTGNQTSIVTERIVKR